jgi:hypothetical protein
MRTLAILMMPLFFAACAQYNDSADRARLMELHEQARRFHFEKNARGIVDGFADDFISVNRGKVDTILNRQEDQQHFQNYFDAVKFRKWDDTATPIIRFSDDHSLAYLTIDKLVVLAMKDSVGNDIEESIHFAWISIFRKRNSDWQLECIASTNEPEVIKAL